MRRNKIRRTSFANKLFFSVVNKEGNEVMVCFAKDGVNAVRRARKNGYTGELRAIQALGK